MLCDNLEGWEVEGRSKGERTYTYLWLNHVDVWQKPTQHCKAIILQLNKNFLKGSYADLQSSMAMLSTRQTNS